MYGQNDIVLLINKSTSSDELIENVINSNASVVFSINQKLNDTNNRIHVLNEKKLRDENKIYNEICIKNVSMKSEVVMQRNHQYN